MAAGQTTIIFRLPIAQYWHSTNPASMVFPKPTSSARIMPLESGERNANKAASIWCGFISTAAFNNDCDKLSILSPIALCARTRA